MKSNGTKFVLNNNIEYVTILAENYSRY